MNGNLEGLIARDCYHPIADAVRQNASFFPNYGGKKVMEDAAKNDE